jgi:hypothetical protein
MEKKNQTRKTNNKVCMIQNVQSKESTENAKRKRKQKAKLRNKKTEIAELAKEAYYRKQKA